ncbi:MAG: hypothetical protein A3C07_01100 [Candidatus Sungbacteria bacterium RIFCSPHIGHO2_02_FULL_47_11]|uniref:Methyltransferase domain-containing protein n=1 Tax=Candidatus Sungbacteria bacterium RIFCSPHIGHO2_02_FULL_47_11 TaxID=1802270 RepID=A0A1G2KLV8_9BACT|nr:MAG: hypothetical protein A3C07_01100 [Candidatus Sungbacteria bacterium RIFCSPHIGHO2_02_FULL_47_11]
MNGISQINEATYDALASEYEGKSALREAFNAEVVKRFLPFIKTGNEILDIGCAVGLDLSIFDARGFSATGIELSSKMASFAQKRNPRADVIVGDFMEVKFNKQFDGVYAQSFIHLFPKAESLDVLKKIKDILKDGGVAHITTSKSGVSGEGFVEKSDYEGNLKHFRKFWKRKELEEALINTGFNTAHYYEIEDPFEKEWMVFIVKK